MEEKAYRRHMQPRLSTRQRAHLWALRSQALFGDAPDDLEGHGRNGGASKNEGKQVALKGVPVLSGLDLPQGPSHWYQFTTRLYYSAWVALRGTMSPQVAAEALCTEFFYLLKVHRVPAMLVVMEAALSTARAKATAAVAMNVTGNGTYNKKLTALCEGFYVRGYHGDPAVIAFLWLCRAHFIPCEVDFEPFAPNKSQGADNMFLVRSLAHNAVVTEPLAAFMLCVELYLSPGEHWFGVQPLVSSSVTHAASVVEKSAWTEYMQHVLVDLRAPLLQFMREMISLERSNEKSQKTQLSARRLDSQCEELSTVVMKALMCYERFAYHYYGTRSKSTVSVADLCVAAYSFVVCTNPLCKSLFRSLDVVSSPTGHTGVEIGSQRTQRGPLYSYENSGTDAGQPTAVENTSTLFSGIPQTYQEIASRILQGAVVASPVTVRVGEEDGRERFLKKKTPFTTGLRLLKSDSPWSGLAPGTNEAAMLVIDRLIQSTFRPVRHRLADIFSYVWCKANEQCVAFPFLVLDKEQQAFVTTSTTDAVSLSRCGAPWMEGGVVEVARSYWLKLRSAFGAPSSSPERRTYRCVEARL
ncbi:hypothetical protein DQ04_00161070 [Trypanosoma grayi]|uniref:hypothetical protein n=1 Tax=Trypanosoma grayi TaxID=71804 RepID=UPI0004F4BD9C|nr:hypothetical protein DQ04_00161070 [Trypanosoma grayi]KEG15167.1 hypothetical protein DQ04_00161070 [Trypanosoma grayi]